MAINIDTQHTGTAALAFVLDETRLTSSDYEHIGRKVVAAAKANEYDARRTLATHLLSAPLPGVAPLRVPTAGGGYCR